METVKKAVCILLTMAMLLVVLPIGMVSAASTATNGTCGENLTWTLDSNGTLTISGTGDMTDYKGSGSPFYNRTDIKQVIIQDGVTSIGDWVFEDCTGLTGITIPDSVTSIGSVVFEWCLNLQTIYGVRGSYAETYVQMNNIPFIAIIIPGHVDGTAGITAADALMALQAATGKIDLDEAATTAADVDGQSGVTANDALLILQYATKKIAAFPAVG